MGRATGQWAGTVASLLTIQDNRAVLHLISDDGGGNFETPIRSMIASQFHQDAGMASGQGRGGAPVVLGIDVGGTNVKLGLITRDGDVLGQLDFPTAADQPPKATLTLLQDAWQRLLKLANCPREQVIAAGLGTPGSMDIERGMLLSPPNLPGWRDFPIVAAVAECLKLPVTYVNDANAAAYGEFWLGSAKDFSSMALFTLGTGIGGGLIVAGRLIEGAHSLGGECGHLIIDWSPQARPCGCGQRGCLEAYASAKALVSRAQERIAGHRGESSALARCTPLSALSIAEAAEQGDAIARELVFETADYLARGAALIGHAIDPQAIVLGGAMNFGAHQTAIGRQFLARTAERTRELVFPSLSERLIIDYASLGSAAGWIGAAGWALNKLPGMATLGRCD